jgi:catechol 2,3-dioxygenase-like lactoylglutathione lyase family enzyme
MSDTIATGAVHHMALTVRDVKQSTEFYTRYLGFQFVVEFGPRDILSNGSVIVALTPPSDPSQAIQDDSFNENRIGLDHVSLSVGSLAELEAAATLLEENGVPHGEINDLGEGFGIYVMSVRDPDNIQLELTATYSQ